MPRARRTRSSQPSPRAQRSPSRRPQTLDIVQFERALRDALRVELARPVSKLVDSLEKLADRLGDGDWGREAERSGLTGGIDISPDEVVEVLTQVTEQPVTLQPEARSCAVIGCRNPPRSLGYCAAHYQKRRLMITSNRLHPLWVENAEPHSVPDVIPPRGPRGERRKAESPGAEAKPTIEPRMFVRKKGQAAAEKAAEAAAAAPQQSEHEAVAAIVGKWAQEFQARKGQS